VNRAVYKNRKPLTAKETAPKKDRQERLFSFEKKVLLEYF